MSISVTFSDEPAWVLTTARTFLASQPVLHNLILTYLHACIAYGEPGQCWVAMSNGTVVGLVFQKPQERANITPMEPEVIGAIVDAIAAAGVALPGVNGEVLSASRFAGQWTERCKSAAVPRQGQRIYEVLQVQELAVASGRLRKAVSNDSNLVADWVNSFQSEIEEPVTNAEDLVGRWLPTGRVWIWETDDQPVSLVTISEHIEGVVRVQRVYTPKEKRSRGYAGASVGILSKQILANGHRCILYTDLGNPTSNSIYRRIGYQAIAEALQYEFK